jgi:hypothetical protein
MAVTFSGESQIDSEAIVAESDGFIPVFQLKSFPQLRRNFPKVKPSV